MEQNEEEVKERGMHPFLLIIVGIALGVVLIIALNVFDTPEEQQPTKIELMLQKFNSCENIQIMQVGETEEGDTLMQVRCLDGN